MILDLLYPPTCLHCHTPLEQNTHFCVSCLELFTLLGEEGRCQKCFSEIPMLRGTCKPCRKRSHPFSRFAACFEAHGPALTLLNAFLKGKRSHLARELASYLVVQLDRLGYPNFDLIVSLPNTFFNPQYALARELSTLLQVPFKPYLKRELNLTPTYHLKKKCNIINQSVLLLDTLTHSHASIYAAAQALQDGWCETTYGLTLCAY